MIVLGLNAFHPDSSAALVIDGRVVAAVEEERFSRVKHWAGFPVEAISWVLNDAKLTIKDVDAIALNTDPKANVGHKIRYALSGKAGIALIMEKLRTRGRRQSIAALLEEKGVSGFNGKVVNIEHHLAHIAACSMLSGFDDSCVVSIDGFGDFCSASWGHASGSNIAINERVLFPHSLGVLYQGITQYLGFPHYGDEYKVMGLAPYGQPTYVEAFEELLSVEESGHFELDLSYFRHQKDPAGFSGLAGAPAFNAVWDRSLESLLGPAREKGAPLEQHHMDIARSLQVTYEYAFEAILNAAQRQSGSQRLCLSGGCAMNSVANGKIKGYGLFEDVFIQPAAGDSGGAIGAAMVAARDLGETMAGERLTASYLGPGYDANAINQVLEAHDEALTAQNIRRDDYDPSQFDEICTRVAKAIAQGKVIGWFQGRQEWGARALGNRSILADARREDMKDILNLKIKMRESFRPFAPSILAAEVPNWFEVVDDVPNMMKVYPIKLECRDKIPAVTHVDGSGRLQSVTAEQNPRYHALISAFFEQTGVPLVVNTSFNENEPIVTTPKHALDCFLRTQMDVLVLNDVILERK